MMKLHFAAPPIKLLQDPQFWSQSLMHNQAKQHTKVKERTVALNLHFHMEGIAHLVKEYVNNFMFRNSYSNKIINFLISC